MESIVGLGLGALTVVALGAFLFIYPFVALGRIWYYSRQQLTELQKITDLLADLRMHASKKPAA